MGLDHFTLPNWSSERSLNNTNSCGNLNKTHACVHMLRTQLCPTLCDPMNCSLPGSSVHEIFQARTLEQVAMPSSRGSSPPRDRTRVFCISSFSNRFFTTEPPAKPLNKRDWAANQLWGSSVKGLRERPNNVQELLKRWQEGHVSGV